MKRYILLLLSCVACYVLKAQSVGCTVTPTLTVKNVDCLHPNAGEAVITYPGILPTIAIRLNDGRTVLGNKITGLSVGSYTATVVGVLKVCPVTFSIVELPDVSPECKALQPLVTSFDDLAGGQCEGLAIVNVKSTSLSNVMMSWNNGISSPIDPEGLFTIDNLCPGTYSIKITSAALPCCVAQAVVKIGQQALSTISQPRLSLETSTDDLCKNQIRVFLGKNPVASIVDNLPYEASETISLCPGEHVYQLLNEIIPVDFPEAPTEPGAGTPTLDSTLSNPVEFIVPDVSRLKPCLSVVANVTDPLCTGATGDQLGKVGLSFQGGHFPYQVFNPDVPSSTTQTEGRVDLLYTGLQSGPFEVIVIDSTGCYGRFSYTLQPKKSTCGQNGVSLCGGTFTISAGSAYCPDSASGSLSAQFRATSATTPTYLWTDGVQDHTRKNVKPGEYTVVVTTGACQERATVTVGYNNFSCKPCPYKLTITNYTLPTSSNPCNGNATVEYTPALPVGYIGNAGKITWSNGSIGATANGLCFTGTYKAYFKFFANQDTPLCQDSITFRYTPVSCDSFAVSVRINKTPTFSSPMGGELEGMPSGGSGNYSYTWDLATTPSTKIKTGLGPGLHTVRVADLTSGCTRSGSVILTAPDSVQCITTSFSAFRPSCGLTPDGSIILKYQGGSPPYRIIYSNGKIVEKSTLVDTLSNLIGGTYSAVILDANNCYGRFSVDLSPAAFACVPTIPCPREFLVRQCVMEAPVYKSPVPIETITLTGFSQHLTCR